MIFFISHQSERHRKIAVSYAAIEINLASNHFNKKRPGTTVSRVMVFIHKNYAINGGAQP